MREHSWPCQFHIIIIATIFNEECPTYETDSKIFYTYTGNDRESGIGSEKRSCAECMSRHNKTTK